MIVRHEHAQSNLLYTEKCKWMKMTYLRVCHVCKALRVKAQVTSKWGWGG